MGRVYDLLVRAKGDSSKARKDMRALSRATRNLKKEIGINFGAIAKAGAAAFGVGLALTVREGVGELVDMQKANAQTAAVLKSTGGAANVTAKHIQELSGALLQKSGVDDQVVQSGANMLLTFTKIRNETGKGNDIFDQATKTMLDMSVAMGTEPKQAAIQLGKALNDPVKGITALQRVGVAFTDGQKKTIKRLVESGKTMEAQKIILKELNTEFGGSAAAAGKTIPAQLSILKESFAGVAAIMVGKMVPAATAAMAEVQKLIQRFSAWAHSAEGKKVISDTGNALQKMVGVVRSAIGVVGKIVALMIRWRGVLIPIASGILAMAAAWKAYKIYQAAANVVALAWNVIANANPVGAIVLAVIGLAAALVVAYKRSETFRKIVNKAFGAVRKTVSVVVGFIKRHWKALFVMMTGGTGAAILLVIKHFGRIKAGVTKIVGFVKAHWKTLLPFLVAPFIALPALIAKRGLEAGKSFVEAIVGFIKEHFKLPTFKIKMKAVPGSGGKIKVPSGFDIKWNRDGGVMRRPTLFGGGEAGDEAIVPLDRYLVQRKDQHGGMGITVHNLTIHASGHREGKQAAEAFLKTLQNSRQRQRAYNPRSRVAIA